MPVALHSSSLARSPLPALTYGDLSIHALPEGRFTVGVDKLFVPYTDGDAPRAGTLFISVTPFLVQTPDETILLDTGLGSWAQGRGTEFLLDGLARHGVAPESVDRVILTHLHFDHAGGAISEIAPGEWRPTFPRADYLVQGAELTADGYHGESEVARERVIETLDQAGQLVLLDDGWDDGRVAVTITGGHTSAHQLIRLRSGDGLGVLFAGDVLATPGSATRRYQAKYDVDGAASQAWRDRLTAQAADDGHLVLFYHSTSRPAAFLAEHAGGVAVEPVAL